MQQIFLIGSAGFIFLWLYNHRTKGRYRDPNSNKFLVVVFACGMIPFLRLGIVQTTALHSIDAPN